MSKQKKAGNTEKAVKDVAAVKEAEAARAAVNQQDDPESARINKHFSRITSTLMTIYVLFYLCIFPLATHDKYFDILKFRFQLYWIPTLIYGILFLVLGILYLISDKRRNGGALTAKLRENLKWNVLKRKLTKTDICFIALIFIMTLSVIFADYQYEALWGNEGRFNGLILWLMFFIAYWLVTRFYHFKKWHLYAYLALECLPEIWGFTDFFLLDLFHFHDGTDPRYIYTFVSSVGNINTYTNMLALHLGASAAMFVLSKETKEALLCWIPLMISSFAMVMGISDNGLLAAAAVFAFLPFVAWTDTKAIARYFIALSSFATSVAVTAQLTVGRATMADCDGGSVLVTLGKTKPFLVLVVLLWAFTIMMVYFFRPKKALQENQIAKRARRIWTLLVVLGVAVTLGILIDANSGNHADIWAPYHNILMFSDSWGTGRGLNWRLACDYFVNDAGLLKKLIGYGPDTYYIITMDRFKKLMQAAGYGYFDSAHNEYIEYITTIGILGTLTYLGILTTGLRQMFKKPKNMFAIACGFAVLAYAVQAVVNIAIPITTPILMMLLYMGISIARESADGKTEMEKRK
ncbi:O-antigen ligase family protein [Oribacterium sp. P9]|uniref:O-antigen ligase family protein n=1 Tax=Oribacterium sp. P9 TaxID=3378068 RepID=UPI003966D8AE